MSGVYRVVWWKELRQLTPLAVALGLLVIGILGAELALDMQSSRGGSFFLDLSGVALIGAWLLFALVSGGMCLAGDREEQTLPWLDTVSDRGPQWNAKVTLAAMAVLAFMATSLAVYVAAVIASGQGSLLPWLAKSSWSLMMMPLLLFLWAVACSGWAKNALTACGIAVCLAPLCSVLASLVFYGTLTIAWQFTDLQRPQPAWYGWLHRSPQSEILSWCFLLGVALAASLASRAIYLRPHAERDSAAPHRRRKLLWKQCVRVGWATLRQSPQKLLVLAVLSAGWWFIPLLCNFSDRANKFEPTVDEGLMLTIVGHGVVLLLGVLCGGFTLVDEQTDDSRRMWGQQGWSLRPLWLVRTAAWLGMALLVWMLNLTLGSLFFWLTDGGPFRAAAEVGFFYNPLIIRQTFLETLTGFAVGMFLVPWFRKPVVAFVAAMVVAAALVLIWGPSISTMQLVVMPGARLGIPCLLLACGWLVLRPWSCDRLTQRRPLLLGAACLAGVVAWDAAALYRRATPVPLVTLPAELSDDAELPPANEVGSQLLASAHWLSSADAKRLAGESLEQQLVQRQHASGEAIVTDSQWVERIAAESNLDALFAQPELTKLASIADGPCGRVPHARRAFLRTVAGRPDREVSGETLLLVAMGRLHAARAMRLSSAGDHGGALAALRIGLAISRAIRNEGTFSDHLEGLELERTTFTALARCIERIGPRPEILRTALADLTRHERELPNLTDCVATSYRIWLADAEMIDIELPAALADSLIYRAMCDTANVPWERVRRERLRRAMAQQALKLVQLEYRQLWGETPLDNGAYLVSRPMDRSRPAPEKPLSELGVLYGAFLEMTGRMWWPEAQYYFGLYGGRLLANRAIDLRAVQAWRIRGAQAMTGLAIFRAEQGRPTDSMDDLVPNILAAPLVDPFSPDGASLKVVTTGRDEELSETYWGSDGKEHERPVRVPAGRQIVLSLGLDMQPTSTTTSNPGHDKADVLREASLVPIRDELYHRQDSDLALVVPLWAEDAVK